MKYRYKDTDIIVESGIELDSMIFTPVIDEPLNKPHAGENVQSIVGPEVKESRTKKVTTKKAPAKKPAKKKGA